jgi:ABC-type arginine transport system permease subunit
MLAVLTIIASIILIVPTAYWIRLRLPEARRIVEFITLLPFVVPAIILVFGLIRIYSSPVTIPFTEIKLLQPLTTFEVGTDILIVAGYVVLGLPYMYRSVDTGMRTVDVRTLTEAAQSLGASWFTIIVRVILPNIRAALLSGALLTFAIVVGEVTLLPSLVCLRLVPTFSCWDSIVHMNQQHYPLQVSCLPGSQWDLFNCSQADRGKPPGHIKLQRRIHMSYLSISKTLQSSLARQWLWITSTLISKRESLFLFLVHQVVERQLPCVWWQDLKFQHLEKSCWMAQI